MVWDVATASEFQKFAGVYSLPGKCWAILSIHPAPSQSAAEAAACPEGYGYAWSILAPGTPPKTRGHRVAGVDNSDDADVRAAIKANPKLGRHRAHRHYPEWVVVMSVNGEPWPVASKGKQLLVPPSSPEDFWDECMSRLEDTLNFLKLPVPSQSELLSTHMTEQAFRGLQKNPNDPDPDPAPIR